MACRLELPSVFGIVAVLFDMSIGEQRLIVNVATLNMLNMLKVVGVPSARAHVHLINVFDAFSMPNTQ